MFHRLAEIATIATVRFPSASFILAGGSLTFFFFFVSGTKLASPPDYEPVVGQLQPAASRVSIRQQASANELARTN